MEKAGWRVQELCTIFATSCKFTKIKSIKQTKLKAAIKSSKDSFPKLVGVAKLSKLYHLYKNYQKAGAIV